MSENGEFVYPWARSNWRARLRELERAPRTLMELDAWQSKHARIPHKVVLTRLQAVADAHHEFTADAVVCVLARVWELMREGARLFSSNANERANKYAPARAHRMLVAGAAGNLVLTRRQCACLIACAVFGLLPAGDAASADTYHVNIHNIWNSTFATACMLSYFDSILCNGAHFGGSTTNLLDTALGIDSDSAATIQQDIIVFKRDLCAAHTLGKSQARVSNMVVDIFDAPSGATLHDHATAHDHTSHYYTSHDNESPQNRALDEAGARVILVPSKRPSADFLSYSAFTYEECVFLHRPECMVLFLLAAPPGANECLSVYGARKYTWSRAAPGAIAARTYAGKYADPAPYSVVSHSARDAHTVPKLQQIALLFVDASSRTSANAQFAADFDRDLTKLWCGFAHLLVPAGAYVITEWWQYGANGNNVELKFLQLILCAAASGRPLAYIPHSEEFRQRAQDFCDRVSACATLTVADLYKIYKRAVREQMPAATDSIFDIIEI